MYRYRSEANRQKSKDNQARQTTTNKAAAAAAAAAAVRQAAGRPSTELSVGQGTNNNNGQVLCGLRCDQLFMVHIHMISVLPASTATPQHRNAGIVRPSSGPAAPLTQIFPGSFELERTSLELFGATRRHAAAKTRTCSSPCFDAADKRSSCSLFFFVGPR